MISMPNAHPDHHDRHHADDVIVGDLGGMSSPMRTMMSFGGIDDARTFQPTTSKIASAKANAGWGRAGIVPISREACG
jgi:hypothetical protein